MNDNDVIAVLRTVILAGLARVGQAKIKVKQSYQPRQTAIEDGPAIYLHKILATRYGFPILNDVFQESSQMFDHTESIWRTPTFQVTGLSVQDPADITQLTASDITEITADVLQSSATRRALLASNIGIQRITTIRDNYILNDQERNEQAASFDFIVSYRRSVTTQIPPVTRYQLNIDRIC